MTLYDPCNPAEAAKPDRVEQYVMATAEKMRAASIEMRVALWRHHPRQMRALNAPPPPRPRAWYRRDVIVPALSPSRSMKIFEADRMIASVAGSFGLTHKDVVSSARGRRYLCARVVIIRLLRDRGWSFPEIGRRLGGRDHSTVTHANARFEHYCERYPLVRSSYIAHVNLGWTKTRKTAAIREAKGVVLESASAGRAV